MDIDTDQTLIQVHDYGSKRLPLKQKIAGAACKCGTHQAKWMALILITVKDA